MRRLLFTAAALLAAAPAHAQFAGSAGGNTVIDADSAVSSQGVTTLTGQVDVRQGGVRILADKMVLYSTPRGSEPGPGAGLSPGIGNIDRIVATGNFYYITPEQEVRGERGVYTAASDQFEVTGDVVLTQDDSVVRGDRLIYDLTTERARVVSECKGRKCGRQRRVSILIKSQPQNGATS